jgi:CRP-like cAMP-binding protein
MQRLDLTPADTVRLSQALRRWKFFGSMDVALLEQVLAGVQLCGFAKGEEVCRQGEAGDAFFVVQQGALTVGRKRGRFSWPRRVATLGPGDCFGEMALLGQAPRNATVACAEASRIFVLPGRHFQAVLARNPEFAAGIRGLAEARQFELDHDPR